MGSHRLHSSVRAGSDPRMQHMPSWQLEPWTACQRRPGKLVALTAPAQDASPLSLHDVAKPTQLTRTMMQAEVLVEATKSSTKRTRCASPTRCANIR